MDITAAGQKRVRDWKSIVLSGGIIAAIVTLAIFGYNTWYNIPVLTYEILPAYPISQTEQVAGVIVRNEGRVSATEVRVVIEGSGQVSILPTRIQEESKITILNSKAVVILPRLPQGAQISLFVKVQTPASFPILDVYLSSLQVMGSKRPTTQDPYSMVLSGLLIIAALSAALGKIRGKKQERTELRMGVKTS